MYKKINRIAIILIIFLFILNVFLVIFVLAKSANAAECPKDNGGKYMCPPDQDKGTNAPIRVQVPIPGLTQMCTYKDISLVGGQAVEVDKPCYYVNSLPFFIKKVYSFSIGIIAIIAVLMMMIGGLRWIFAAGNASKIAEARSTITAALAGLILALFSYVILAAINPRLTNLSLPGVTNINPIQQPTVWCKDYPDGTIIQELAEDGPDIIKEIKVRKNNNNEIVNGYMFLCPGYMLRIPGVRVINKYRIKDELTGTKNPTYCLGHTCDKGACVSKSFNYYDCTDGFWSGSLSYKNDQWPTEIKLVSVCDGDVEYREDTSITKHIMKIENPKDNFYYSVPDGDLSFIVPNTPTPCNPTKANFFLLVKVNRPWWKGDQWYAVDRNCDPITTQRSSDPNEINWTMVNKSLLVSYKELSNFHTCNLMVDERFTLR